VNIDSFVLERFFAQNEFAVRHMFSASDCSGPSLRQLLTLADEDCRSLWHELGLGYTETKGHPLLREEISCLYAHVSPEDIVVLTPEEGIFLIMHALLHAGDHVVCTSPAYQSLHSVARSLGCHVDFWTSREKDGWHFSVGDLARLLRDDTRLLVVNFPHNPTGALPTTSEWGEILEFAAAKNVYVFSDEMYRLLELGGTPPLAPATDLYERAVCLGGMSKTFGLPGLRIGWLATRDAGVLGEVERLRDYTTICSSAPSEILALIALRARSTLVAEHRARIAQNLRLLQECVERNAGRLSLSAPRAGSVCLLRIHGEQAGEISRRARYEQDLLVLPSGLLGMDDTHVRVGLGRHSFPEALSLFEEVLPDPKE